MADDDAGVSWSDLPGRRSAPESGDAPDAPPPPPAPAAPFYTPPPPPRRRSRLAIAAIALGVLATLGGATFAVTQLAGDEGSPEKAVQRLLDAAADEDILGVLEALPPSERDPIRDSLSDLVAEAKRLELLSGDFDLNKLPGVDLSFEGVKLSSASLAENLATVRIDDGRSKFDTDPSKLPFGAFIKEMAGNELAEARPTSEESPAGGRLVTLKEDGKWYVSLWYSVAESARRAAEAPFPDLNRRLAARGADTPEAAVDDLLRAAARFNVRRLIELMPPDEARALHDYAPLFIDAIGEGTPGLVHNVAIEITELELTAETDGDEALVRIRDVGINGTVGPPGPPEEQFRFSYRDGCAGFSPPGEPQQQVCGGDLASGEAFRQFGISDAEAPKLDVGTPKLGFVTVRRDGKWFVSPTRTQFESITAVMRVLDRADLDQIRDYVSGLSGMIYVSGLSGMIRGDFGEGFSEDSGGEFDPEFGPGPDPGPDPVFETGESSARTGPGRSEPGRSEPEPPPGVEQDESGLISED